MSMRVLEPQAGSRYTSSHARHLRHTPALSPSAPHSSPQTAVKRRLFAGVDPHSAIIPITTNLMDDMAQDNHTTYRSSRISPETVRKPRVGVDTSPSRSHFTPDMQKMVPPATTTPSQRVILSTSRRSSSTIARHKHKVHTLSTRGIRATAMEEIHRLHAHTAGSSAQKPGTPQPLPMNADYMREISAMHQRSITQPDAFWLEQAHMLDWFRKPSKGVNYDQLPFHTWFEDGTTNLAYLCLDANIAKGRGEQLALVLEDAYHQQKRTLTYNELKKEVDIVANAMQRSGVTKGDHVMLYMPMIMETPIVMLACARLGAVHSVVFGGFASHELAKRIDAFQPKMLFTASCGLEPCKVVNYKQLVDGAHRLAKHSIPMTVYVNREENHLNAADLHSTREMLYSEWVDKHTHQANTVVDAVELPANHPSYVIYTSGTTGAPKGVVRDVGGYATMLNHSMRHVYGINPGERWMAASDFGWVVGHSFILYGPLIAGTTSVMLDGKPINTPDASTYWRVLAEWQVKGFFTAPTAIRAIKQQDPTLAQAEPYRQRIHEAHPTLFLAGERSDNDSVLWLQDRLRVPIVDHYWSTEIGAPCTIIPRSIALSDATKRSLAREEVNPFNNRIGSTGLPAPGFDIRVVDDNGHPVGPHTHGNIVINTPLPPGFMLGLYNDKARYQRGYFDKFKEHGFYDTADSGYMDQDGFVYVMSRTDDVFNVAGHRLSTGAIEEAVADDPHVAENCVVPLPDAIKGSLPIIFVVKKAQQQQQQSTTGADGDNDDAIRCNVKTLIREHVGAVATPKDVIIVPKLPKTRSGKVLRATIRHIFAYLEHMAALQREVTTPGEDVHDHGMEVFQKMVPFPSTIEDPEVIQQILKVCIDSKLIPGVPPGLLSPCSLETADTAAPVATPSQQTVTVNS